MIKFLHCADLHLDSPLAALDLRRASVRRGELRAALTSLTMSAKANAADLLIISGDLFDSSRVSRETMDLLIREFAQISDTRVIIAPGNHDPYTHSSYYRRAAFSDNVYIFDSNTVTSFDFPEINTTVYGFAFTEPHMAPPSLEGFHVENPDRINLLALHADLDVADSPYCGVSSAALAACGFDYVALGHRHAHDGINPLGKGYISYSGCLEGRGFDELGMKGAVLAAADKSPTLKFAAKFVPYCKKHYEIETVDLTDALSHADVLKRISAMLAEKHYGEDTILRVRLTGRIAGDVRLSPAYLTEQFKQQLFYVEFADETLPSAKNDSLAEDPTLRGAFYRSLSAMLESEDASEREIAAQALRYGLAALAGEDVTEE